MNGSEFWRAALGWAIFRPENLTAKEVVLRIGVTGLRNSDMFHVLTKLAQPRNSEEYHFIPRSDMMSVKRRSLKNCGAGHNSYAISSSGIVKPCIMMPDDYLPIDNIFTESCEEIFAKPIPRILAKTPWPKESYCRNCEYERFCRYCIFRGGVMYKCGLLGVGAKPPKGEKCKWAKVAEIDKLLSFSSEIAKGM